MAFTKNCVLFIIHKKRRKSRTICVFRDLECQENVMYISACDMYPFLYIFRWVWSRGDATWQWSQRIFSDSLQLSLFFEAYIITSELLHLHYFIVVKSTTSSYLFRRETETVIFVKWKNLKMYSVRLYSILFPIFPPFLSF